MKKVFVCFLILMLIISSFQFTAFADTTLIASNGTSDNENTVKDNSEVTYDEYVKDFENVSNNENFETVIIPANSYIFSENAEISVGDDSSLNWKNESGFVTWQFDIKNEGYYNISLITKAIDDVRTDITYSALIDGETLFSEMNLMQIQRKWANEETEAKFDNNGNQLRSQVKQLFDWQENWFKDTEGIYSDYFIFKLSAGHHTLTLSSKSGAFAIKEIKIAPFFEKIGYDEYLKNNSDIEQFSGNPFTLEAENTSWFTSVSILPQTDMSSPYTTPYSPSKALMNTVGGANWKYSWDKISWNVVAPKDGLYKISIRFRQNYSTGMKVYRSLFVNGEIPFKEVSEIGFDYSQEWQAKPLDYYIKLNKGDNEVSLQVTMGSVATIVRDLQNLTLDLNSLYRKIIMITGSSPDTNRDYNLKAQISGLTESMESLADRMDSLLAKIKSSDGVVSSEMAILQDFSRILRDNAKHDYKLTRNGGLDSIKSKISSLGALISSFREQPLEIDSFYIGGKEFNVPKADAGFFDSAVHKFKRFLASFTEDYSASSEENKKSVRVWLFGLGRDQMQIIKGMCDDTFVPNTNIPVKLELVTSNVIDAVFAGNGPDIVINEAISNPVNFAMRGIAEDISEFDGFNEVIKQFPENSMLPYRYENGYYALPLTLNYSMLFVRNDIMSELGLEVPNTWDDLVKKALPILKKNNLEAGIGTLASIQTMEGYNLFTSLLYQNNGSIYNKELSASNLCTQESFDSFKKAISYYKEYKFPQSYDALNRFRTGEMPMIISGYSFYNNLAVGAPEIRGLWDMYLIPGTEINDNSITRAQVFGGTASIMLKCAKNKKNAWEFLKWWSGEEAQTRYGLEQEAILGAAGRYMPANVNAMSNLPWTNSQLKTLVEQRAYCVSVPQIPGSYFTSRAINNAFLTCVLNDKLPREELVYWSEQIDFELERKRNEFNYKVGGYE